MARDIFISYSRKDKDSVHPFVKQVCERLGENSCWIDLKGIESGEEFEDVIMQAINSSQVVLFMLSDNSLQSKWTKREVYFAEKRKKRIVPIVVDGNGLRGWFDFHFGNVDFIDIRSSEHKEKLINNLKNWLETNKNITSNKELSETKEDTKLKAEEQYEIGNEYFFGLHDKKQDYTEAIKWLRKAAELGHATAQFDIGYCYEKGLGVQQNSSEAIKWFRKSAEQGNASAQCSLGNSYTYSRGAPQDYAEALKWYQKAAEQGKNEALYAIGSCFYFGHGVSQDYTEAAKWYRKAANQGMPEAQFGIGCCYYSGYGVQQDYAEAAKWFRKAADQGSSTAKTWLEELEKKGY